ncbi:MAG: DUF4339 domain-containing protein [Alphaproteobacteria bacterium]|nr:DUF4339 domain-containing protein [Alphaproteobacteria bacterium]
MADTWNMSVAGRMYGPYTTEQLQAFLAEGRLASHSLIAAAGEDNFHPAGDEPRLAHLFAPKAPATVPQAQPISPVPSATGKFVTQTGAGLEFDDDDTLPTFGRSVDEPRTGERSRFLIVADMKSRSISGLEEVIFNLGPAYSLMPQAWLLTSDQPINAIRNTLVQKLGKMDMLFIVDATHNKAAWFNFGPESDTRIRRVWTAQHEPIAQRQAS